MRAVYIFLLILAGCTPVQPYTDPAIQAKAARELQQRGDQAKPYIRHIPVTAGTISQPYNILGQVYANTQDAGVRQHIAQETLAQGMGYYMFNYSRILVDQETADKLLSERAMEQYGIYADAVINANYQVHRDTGSIFASGLVVHFTEANN